MRIITDTCSMFTPLQEEEYDIDVLPLSVSINNKTYTEFVDIQSEELIEMIKEGGIPSSSQPSIGHTIEVLEKYPDEDIIVITMADGLSGTYSTTVAAKNSVDNPERIHVINSMTLCGPEHYLVKLAIKLRDEGYETQNIVNELHKCISFTKSFLIPSDFEFLKRGGRCTPLTAKLGGMLKIIPTVTITEDGKRLESFSVKKTVKGAIKAITNVYKEMGVGANDIIYISHACAIDRANQFKHLIQSVLPDTEIIIQLLTPVFVTQGGPGCVSIQMIRKS